jgi:hypothetical protein
MQTQLRIIVSEQTPAFAELEAGARDSKTVACDLTKPDPDYEKLLELIFEADSILVW